MTTMFEVTRAGGREPSDDEHLVVDDDGSFRMWRTVGWTRVGMFGGTLDGDVLRRLGDLLPSSTDDGVVGEVPRYAATETYRTLVGSVSVGGSSDPPKVWGPVVQLGRTLMNDLTAHPVAALELVVSSPVSAELSVVGVSDLALSQSSIRWWAERLNADGLQSAVWRPDTPHGQREVVVVSRDELETHSPGSAIPLTIAHGWDLAPAEVVRVWVTLGIGAVDGREPAPRTARLVAVHPTG